MTESNKKKRSKYISMILRHKPEEAGLVLDQHGYVAVHDLLAAMRKKPHLYTSAEELQEIVETNDKKRFEYSKDGTMIRASQGHSIDVDLHYEPIKPPEFLYHGTSGKYLHVIFSEGLKRMKRNHVHLSKDVNTAIKVGMRKGKPIILEIKSKEMYEEGYVFYCSTNNVWLTDHVPTKYIRLSSKNTKGRL